MPVISGGRVVQPGQVLQQEVTFTEVVGNNAAGTYTGSVTVPAGAYLVDVILHGVAVWNSGSAVDMKVGDVADDNGIFTGIDLKATDLLAAEGLAASGVGGSSGSEAGADLANSQWSRRWLATERIISGIVTCSGASGTTGVTRMVVIYTDPATPAAAVFAAS